MLGGDGTIANVASEMAEHGVRLESVHFALLPFGTGNDLSQVLGWGARLTPQMEKADLNWTLQRVLEAREDRLSMWEVTVELREDGDMLLPRKGQLMSFGRKRVKKLMTNYFSIGLCAQSGHLFEKKRTKNRCCNDIMYTLEGFKLLCGCVRRMPRIGDVLAGVYRERRKPEVESGLRGTGAFEGSA